MDWGVLVQLFAPIIGMLITALIKRYLPQVPKPLLPVIATTAGAIAAAVGGADATHAVALGGSSVGLREIVDQTKKALGEQNGGVL